MCESRTARGRCAALVLGGLLLAAGPSPAAGCCSSTSDAGAATTEDELAATTDAQAVADALIAAMADEIRREWNVKCDAANFDIYDSDPAKCVKLTVTNNGACPFKMTFTKADNTTEDFTVPNGTPKTVNRPTIKKITIDCDGAAPNDCKASYTLVECTAFAVDEVDEAPR